MSFGVHKFALLLSLLLVCCVSRKQKKYSPVFEVQDLAVEHDDFEGLVKEEEKLTQAINKDADTIHQLLPQAREELRAEVPNPEDADSKLATLESLGPDFLKMVFASDQFLELQRQMLAQANVSQGDVDKPEVEKPELSEEKKSDDKKEIFVPTTLGIIFISLGSYTFVVGSVLAGAGYYMETNSYELGKGVRSLIKKGVNRFMHAAFYEPLIETTYGYDRQKFCEELVIALEEAHERGEFVLTDGGEDEKILRGMLETLETQQRELKSVAEIQASISNQEKAIIKFKEEIRLAGEKGGIETKKILMERYEELLKGEKILFAELRTARLQEYNWVTFVKNLRRDPKPQKAESIIQEEPTQLSLEDIQKTAALRADRELAFEFAKSLLGFDVRTPHDFFKELHNSSNPLLKNWGLVLKDFELMPDGLFLKSTACCEYFKMEGTPPLATLQANQRYRLELSAQEYRLVLYAEENPGTWKKVQLPKKLPASGSPQLEIHLKKPDKTSQVLNAIMEYFSRPIETPGYVGKKLREIAESKFSAETTLKNKLLSAIKADLALLSESPSAKLAELQSNISENYEAANRRIIARDLENAQKGVKSLGTHIKSAGGLFAVAGLMTIITAAADTQTGLFNRKELALSENFDSEETVDLPPTWIKLGELETHVTSLLQQREKIRNKMVEIVLNEQ